MIWQLKDYFGLEHHRAKTLSGLLSRLATKVAAYTCGQWLNSRLDRPRVRSGELFDRRVALCSTSDTGASRDGYRSPAENHTRPALHYEEHVYSHRPFRASPDPHRVFRQDVVTRRASPPRPVLRSVL